jgi:hypothetical protein
VARLCLLSIDWWLFLWEFSSSLII